MTRAILLSSVTAVCVAMAGPSFSAEPTTSIGSAPPPAARAAPGATPAAACASDVRAFSEKMQKSANWMGDSDYGHGYPVDGYDYDYDYRMMGYPAGASAGYLNARPGYEIRNLITTANIHAQNGQQQACEAVLATTRTIYTSYAANFHGRDGSMTYGADWRKQQIESATPVADSTAALRSDQLIDDDVRVAQGNALGSVHDLVIDAKTGKIAYLIVARGGLFGFDEKFVPVPWNDFKITRNANLLVLVTTKAIVAAAPMVTDAQFRASGQFAEHSQKWTRTGLPTCPEKPRAIDTRRPVAGLSKGPVAAQDSPRVEISCVGAGFPIVCVGGSAGRLHSVVATPSRRHGRRSCHSEPFSRGPNSPPQGPAALQQDASRPHHRRYVCQVRPCLHHPRKMRLACTRWGIQAGTVLETARLAGLGVVAWIGPRHGVPPTW